MPFDGTETPFYRRARLIEALRKNDLPAWDFCECETCAIGLAAQIGLVRKDINTLAFDTAVAEIRHKFGLNRTQVGQIFGWGRRQDVLKQMNVTPKMVADWLEDAHNRV